MWKRKISLVFSWERKINSVFSYTQNLLLPRVRQVPTPPYGMPNAVVIKKLNALFKNRNPLRIMCLRFGESQCVGDDPISHRCVRCDIALAGRVWYTVNENKLLTAPRSVRVFCLHCARKKIDPDLITRFENLTILETIPIVIS